MPLERNQATNDNRLQGFPIIGNPDDTNNTLQFDNSKKQFIWVAGSSGGGVSEQFYQDKILAGDSFEVSGDIDTLAAEIAFVVPTGKTAFITEAKITITGNPSAVSAAPGNSTSKNMVSAALKIDGTTKDETSIGVSAAAAGSSTNQNGGGSGSGFGNVGNGEFNFKMLSLIGDGAKKITIENILDAGTAFAQLSGYVIATP